eukprot:COSAG02_NODE_33499_length_499_cov_0.680000_2_plen_114_part_00
MLAAANPHLKPQCNCSGNAEANNDDTGEESMEAVYMGSWNATGKGWCGGSGAGPWVMAVRSCPLRSLMHPALSAIHLDSAMRRTLNLEYGLALNAAISTVMRAQWIAHSSQEW